MAGPRAYHTYQVAVNPDNPAYEVSKNVWNADLTLVNIPGTDIANTFAATQTFTVAPVFTQQSQTRTALGLGTAATTASTDYATAAQGAKADSALQASAIIDSIADADTTHAPSRNAVFDALALKADASAIPNPTLFACNTSANSLSDVNTVQNIFPAAIDTLTVEASTAYFFEGVIVATTGTTSYNAGFGFGGTATLTAIGYAATGIKATAGTISTNINNRFVTTATCTAATATNTTGGAIIMVNGIVRVNGAGTLIPQIQFSAAPGGTNQIEANSFIRFRKIGSDTVTSSGSWS